MHSVSLSLSLIACHACNAITLAGWALGGIVRVSVRGRGYLHVLLDASVGAETLRHAQLCLAQAQDALLPALVLHSDHDD
jgi:hypothetical protein